MFKDSFMVFQFAYSCSSVYCKVAHWEFMEPKVLSIMVSRFYDYGDSF
jgi:hypothetical protein